ncbi:MAG: 2-dehydropantoate 2-reductase [Geminicoccaceae bacterium]|nr:2-dehydropantoate 2-reductase [Geminicoccaceae bacterium]MCX7630137.1 2-dehydropantoate 2-reductase [Geminicoccaceae bacterium]MDW8124815.1 2-dehydropantoate 2-reductase [Geminicoccaceae bacterium]
MRILVVGAGAVGGYFGARLAAAGVDVAFLARGAQAAALRERGLVVLSPLGDLRLSPVRVFVPGDRADRRADLLLVTVKMYDLERAAIEIARHLHGESLVLPLENGVEAGELLARSLPRARIAAGVAYIGAQLAAPGVIRHTGTLARLVFGPADGAPEPRLEAFARACRRAAIDHRSSPAMSVELWRKFVFLAPFSALTTLARAPAGALREDPALWARLAALVEEAVAVGRARGVPLPADLVADRLALLRALPAEMRSSMLVDFEAGRPLELEWLLGAVVRMGEAAGVQVPVSRAVLAALRAQRAATGERPDQPERTSR